MIFVTVGGQTPFDRLVRAMDAWSGKHPRERVFAQIGETDHEPSHMEFVRFLPPGRYERRMENCDLVVSHAGTGVLLVAARVGVPVLMMPRSARLGETRNEHQAATCRHLAGRCGFRVALSDEDLPAMLDEARDTLSRPGVLPADQLVAAISGFLRGDGV